MGQVRTRTKWLLAGLVLVAGVLFVLLDPFYSVSAGVRIVNGGDERVRVSYVGSTLLQRGTVWIAPGQKVGVELFRGDDAPKRGRVRFRLHVEPPVERTFTWGELHRHGFGKGVLVIEDNRLILE